MALWYWQFMRNFIKLTRSDDSDAGAWFKLRRLCSSWQVSYMSVLHTRDLTFDGRYVGTVPLLCADIDVLLCGIVRYSGRRCLPLASLWFYLVPLLSIQCLWSFVTFSLVLGRLYLLILIHAHYLVKQHRRVPCKKPKTWFATASIKRFGQTWAVIVIDARWVWYGLVYIHSRSFDISSHAMQWINNAYIQSNHTSRCVATAWCNGGTLSHEWYYDEWFDGIAALCANHCRCYYGIIGHDCHHN